MITGSTKKGIISFIVHFSLSETIHLIMMNKKAIQKSNTQLRNKNKSEDEKHNDL